MAQDLVLSASLPASFKKEGRYYIASCKPLGVMTQATTKKKAEKNLIEALTLFFVSCIERDSLDAALKDLGFSLAKSPVKTKKASRSNFVDVPIPYVRNRTEKLSATADAR